MGHVAAQPAVKQKWAMVERPAIRSPGCQSVGVPDAVRSPARQRLKPVPSSNETVRAGNRHPWVQALRAAPAARHFLTVVRITLAETVAAVTRKERARLITAQGTANALNDFHVDFAHQIIIVELCLS